MNKKAKMKTLAREIAKKFNVNINTSTILGNLKDETLERIEKTNPDIIVLGKRSPKWVNFLGDGFTKFILDEFNGSVLISGKEKAMSASEIMSIGMLNTTADELQVEIAQDLRKHTKSPIKRFSVRSSSEKNIEKTVAKTENVITYEFESGTNTMDNIASYVAKNNIGLLCMNQQSRKNSRLKNFTSNIKEAIHKINVPILIVKNESTIQLQ
jgi:nucleotide-binding universal stress UspA family protein